MDLARAEAKFYAEEKKLEIQFAKFRITAEPKDEQLVYLYERIE